jgi:hypothetical protein
MLTMRLMGCLIVTLRPIPSITVMLVGSGVGVGAFVEDGVGLLDDEVATVGGVTVAVGDDGMGDMGEGNGEEGVSGL